jgi:hypothetical protein
MLASLRPQPPNALPQERLDHREPQAGRSARVTRLGPERLRGRVADATGKPGEFRNRAKAPVSKTPVLPYVTPGEGNSALRRPSP